MSKLFSKILPSMGVLALMTAGPAFAQNAPANRAAEDVAAEDEIVVTGTQIRGVAATGSQTIRIDAEAIAERAAGSTNELLSLIPQITNTFNGRFEGDPRGVGAGISITKPNLRNLPGANSTSGGTTLVLMDGFRFTPVGVNQSAVDVDVIPGAVLAGIDTVTDGGSSLYGADAVAGVINFRPMREFDGFKVDTNYGFGDTISAFNQWDAQLTGGLSWSSGNAYVSGGYSHRDLVLNNETTWATGEVFSAAGVPRFNGTQCNSPVGTETRWFRFGPGAAQFTNNPLAPGAGTFAVGTACDDVGRGTYSPQNVRSNVFAHLTNEFSDAISLQLTAYFTKRDQEINIFPRGATSAGSGITSGAQVGALFPAAAVGSISTITEGTGFSFAPNAAYVNTPQTLGFETWGLTPELTFDLGNDWQLRTTAHVGQSSNSQAFPGVDAIRAQCYITGTAGTPLSATPCAGISAGGQLNPLNVAAASAAVIHDLLDFETAQDTDHQLVVVRAVGDGPLFQLPGGDARLAVGVEYQDNEAKSRVNTGRVGTVSALPFRTNSRDSYSAFGELSLPVTDFLDLSGSVRYDKYSDFGSTTNPSLGFSLHPVDGLRVYGHWGTSFNAPTALDGLGFALGRFACGIYTVGLGSASRPTDPFARDNGQGTCALVAEGVKAGIKPQTSESWALGFEAEPTEGLRIGGQFYSIDFADVLAAVDSSNQNTFTTNPDLYLYALTPAQYAAFLAQLTNGNTLAAQQPSSNIAIIADRRASNIGTALLEGLDFHAYYDRPMGDADLSLGLTGTLTTTSRANFGVPTNELGNGVPELFFTAFAGVDFGGFSSQATLNYSGDYRSTGVNQFGRTGDRVNAFTTVNLNFGYEFAETGPLSGTSLRLAVNNVLEELPQSMRRGNANSNRYENWTLGREIRVGFSKTF